MMRTKSVSRSINFFLQIALVTLLPLSLLGQGLELSQSLKPNSIPFESSAQFEITISWPGPQTAYIFPKPLRPQFERLIAGELSSSISSVGTGADEVTTKKYIYTLSPSLSGVGRVEPITIEYVSWPDSVAGMLVTEPMMISIEAPQPKSPDDDSSGGPGWLFVIVGIVLAGGVAAYFLIIRKRPEQPEALSPEQQFLAELEVTKDGVGSDLKRFQTELHRALYNYLIARYGLPSGLTGAKEIEEKLKGCELTPSEREALMVWISRAERERFTPVTPDPGATTRLYAEVKQFFEAR